MEAGEYGLTRGTCFVACRHEEVVVGAVVDFVVYFTAGFFVFFFSFFLRTHTACCKCEAALPHLPLY